MAKKILQIEFWPGPLRPTAPRRAVWGTRCVQVTDGRVCGNPTINGEWWCQACKDPDGYTERLRQAQQAMRQRTLEAYPVCRHCGARLSVAQVQAGITAHAQEKGQCLPPLGPLAERPTSE